MSDGHRLVQAMRRAGQTPQNEVVDLILGEVTSIKPLKVKIENRELTETFLVVGALCKETRLTDPAFTVPTHTHTVPSHATESAESHQHSVGSQSTSEAASVPSDLVLWRGLRVGDKVLMLKVGRGQKYFVMQRVEGVMSA